MLMKKYEITKNQPKPIEWDEYESIIKKEYKDIIKNNANDETVFQNFFEKNPCMVPGAYGLLNGPGHEPFNNALITQPKLQGLTTRIPDFLWIAYDSCNIYPILIEIEKPSKKWFVKSGNPSAEFTNAQTQLADWKVWFAETSHQDLFFKYYNVDTKFREGKRVQPKYVLIYGCSDEFINKPELNLKRSQLERENEIYMTFNRLNPDVNCRDIVTCTVKEKKYTAKYIQPVFRFKPVLSRRMSQIHGIEKAIIKNDLIGKERKEFLQKRLTYWNEYSENYNIGVENTSDWE